MIIQLVTVHDSMKDEGEGEGEDFGGFGEEG